jgi:hypothetical protein
MQIMEERLHALGQKGVYLKIDGEK